MLTIAAILCLVVAVVFAVRIIRQVIHPQESSFTEPVEMRNEARTLAQRHEHDARFNHQALAELPEAEVQEKPSLYVSENHGQPNSPMNSLGRRLARPVRGGKVPLAVPLTVVLAWAVAILVAMAAGWSLHVNVPPKWYAELTGVVPTPTSTPSATPKPKNERAAEQQAAEQHQAEAQYQESRNQALEEISREIPVWQIFFGVGLLAVAGGLLIWGLLWRRSRKRTNSRAPA